MQTSPLLILLATLVATCPLIAREATERQSPHRVWHELRGDYARAETYQDQGAVRAVRVRVHRDRPETDPDAFEILEETELYFETAHRKGGYLQIAIAEYKAGEQTGWGLFERSALDHSVRARGSMALAGGNEPILSRIDRTLSIHDVAANIVVGLLTRDSSQPPYVLFQLSMEEDRFSELPVYRLTGHDHRKWELVHLWIHQSTRLILGQEKIVMLTPDEAIVVTTLFRPVRNAPARRIASGADDGRDLHYDPAEWSFPPLDLPAALALYQVHFPPGTYRLPGRPVEIRHEHPSFPPVATVPRQPPEPAQIEPPPEEPPREEKTSQERQPLTQRLSAEEMASIVIIEGTSGQGSGFICRINDRSFVITNLHVLADAGQLRIRNSRGNLIQPRAVHAARGHDVALIRIDDIDNGFSVTTDATASRIGDEVVVVGNRLGGGVLTQESGQIVGIGPERIEVDARFQPGNSGSPIVNVRTGEVIGVATYLEEVSIMGSERAATDESGRLSREVSTRWFGYRIDSITQWERLDWAEWRRQGERVQTFYENSNALFALLRGDRPVYMNNPEIRSIVERYERRTGSRLTRDELARQNRMFVNDLINFSQSDLRTLEGSFYDYYRTSLYFETSIPMQLEFRQELTKFLRERERDFRHFSQMLGR